MLRIEWKDTVYDNHTCEFWEYSEQENVIVLFYDIININSK